MAKLYVGNPKFQVHQFWYTLPETVGRKEEVIPIGGQKQIGGVLSQAAIDTIVGYYLPYGMVREDEAPARDRMVTLVYSVDKPIRPERLQQFFDHNRGVQVKVGIKNRQDAAVGVSELIDQRMFEMQLPDRLERFSMSVQEDSESPTIAEGVVVDRNAPPPPSGRRRR